MAKDKRVKRKGNQSRSTNGAQPNSLEEQMTALKHEFSSYNKYIKKHRIDLAKWSNSTKKLLKTSVNKAVNDTVSKAGATNFSSEKDKTAFKDLILTKLHERIPWKLPNAEHETRFLSLHESINDFLSKIQALQPAPTQQDNAEAIPPPDPATFTISLGVPHVAEGHRFAVAFKDERVVKGLDLIPDREIWQLVRDMIHHDSDIPSRTPKLFWIADVKQLNDNRLAFKTNTAEDLDTVTSKVQWLRNLRNFVSSGIKTYKVAIENINIRWIKTEENEDMASVVDGIRKENSQRISSIEGIGAIRDVMMLPDRASRTGRNVHADFVLVLGYRETANAALNMGLRYRGHKRTCVIYSPETQWHQQCSNCQGHDHTTNRCQSTATCGKCGYEHLTQYCKSAILTCANCQGEHIASSKTCPKWLEAEEKAHRAYRFPADKDDCAKAKAAPTMHPPALPPPVLQKPQEILNEKSKVLPPPVPQKPRDPLDNERMSIDGDQTPPAAPSSLLQAIDEFRAFVAARENASIPNPKPKSGEPSDPMTPALPQISAHKEKRKREAGETEYVMAGALQTAKRIKMQVEEEGPVWPIGQMGYQAPSLRQSSFLETSSFLEPTSPLNQVPPLKEWQGAKNEAIPTHPSAKVSKPG